MVSKKLFVNSLHLTDKCDRMTKEEFIDSYYPGLKCVDFSESRNIIQNALWDSYDKGKIIDVLKFKFAYQVCVPLYNKLKEYEDRIKHDIDELDGKHGTPRFCMVTVDEINYLIQDMAFICDTYHKYFEAFNESTIETMANMTKETPTDQEDVRKSDEMPISDVYSNENEMINLKSDQDPAHRKWFVKVLNTKIPTKPNKDRDLVLYDNLKQLYKELSDSDFVNPNEEDQTVFIYRFSGLKGPFSPERKIEWKGKQVFLGYIVRCLLSDKTNAPEGLGKVASFFDSITNLSVDNIIVKDYEKEKERLHPYFVEAVEILRKCGFVNVEFTSARR